MVVEPVDFLPRPAPVDEIDKALSGLLAQVRGLTGPDELDGYALRLADGVRVLVDGGAEALQASRAIATVNDAVVERLLSLAQGDLGPPPCRYAWVELGSEGRREQALLTDQDNALVYAEGGRPQIDGYFAALAERAVDGLLRAGFPHCPGGYMATRWRRPYAEWEAVLRRWVDGPDPRELVEAEVFLDFRRVSGDLPLGRLDLILGAGGDRPRFLTHMARAAVAFPPPLGLLGRIHAVHRQVDLKRGGLAPIVLLGRLYALAAGSVVRPTLERLAAAANAGTLSRAGAAQLAESYRLLADLRLHAQLRKVAAGEPPDNKVSLDDLTQTQRRRLREVLHVVQDLQKATALRFHTDAVS